MYVPDKLLAEVRSADIAVSGVCQLALEAEVLRCAMVAEANRDLRAVASRLAQTREAAEDRRYEKGSAFGVRWARQFASLDELERVARAAGRGRELDYRSLPSLFALLMDEDPDHYVDPDGGVNGEVSSYDRGFFDGAVLVYESVRPLLDAAQSEVRRHRQLDMGPAKPDAPAARPRKAKRP